MILMLRKRFVYGIAAVGILSGCGPNMKVVRQYMAHSPHRRVAVLPFDRLPGQKDLSLHAADMMETKMRRLGFQVTDRQIVRPLLSQSPITGRSFDNLQGDAEFGRSLGVESVLAGAIDESYERIGKSPAQYEMVTNPIPACCIRPTNPCPSTLVFDPAVSAYVDSCGPTHRRILISQAATLQITGFSARVRMIDVNTGSVIWESKEQAQPNGASVYNAADIVTDVIVERLLEDFVKEGL